MKIGIANDHSGVEIKNQIQKFLELEGYEVMNYGTDTKESVDYPLYAFKIGQAINTNKIKFGILICHTGIGMSIAANKVKNIRCAKVNTEEEAFLTRSHNDSNVIAFNDKKNIEELKPIIKTFLETPFSKEDRHQRRIDLIHHYEC